MLMPLGFGRCKMKGVAKDPSPVVTKSCKPASSPACHMKKAQAKGETTCDIGMVFMLFGVETASLDNVMAAIPPFTGPSVLVFLSSQQTNQEGT